MIASVFFGFSFLLLVIQCFQHAPNEGIISDWVVNDKEYLNGRKDIFYYFEQENITYTLNIGGPIKVASDPFYNEEVLWVET